MAAFSQTIFSGIYSWMKSFVFWLRYHWSLFLRALSTIIQHWHQAIIWTNADLIHWCLYAALGREELISVSKDAPITCIKKAVSWAKQIQCASYIQSVLRLGDIILCVAICENSVSILYQRCILHQRDKTLIILKWAIHLHHFCFKS